MSSLLAQVLATISKVKGIQPDSLETRTPLESLELDSLDEVEIMMFLEEELAIEIDQTRIARCKTIGDLVEELGHAQLRG